MASSFDRSLIFVKILEQPAPKALRFRYECEGRSAGSLPGANSTPDKKTFPKIQVVSQNPQLAPLTRAVVVVSCVTVDPPYRPHPHNLVGKEGCKKGVCTVEMIPNEMGDVMCEFSNLGIQCVKKKDIEDSLKVREDIRVDPYRTGFAHKNQPGSIDLNAVRLCIQVFMEGPEKGQYKIPLTPITTDPIYDKKAINDLTIMKLSDCSSPVLGNKEIILLCDKVSKDDIEVRFYEEAPDGKIAWEGFGDFQPSDVHKQYAITFKTPQFRDLEITSPARVWIQLRCPSKDTTSHPRPFEFTPLSSDVAEGVLQTKRKRYNVQRLDNHVSMQDGSNYFTKSTMPSQNTSNMPAMPMLTPIPSVSTPSAPSPIPGPMSPSMPSYMSPHHPLNQQQQVNYYGHPSPNGQSQPPLYPSYLIKQEPGVSPSYAGGEMVWQRSPQPTMSYQQQHQQQQEQQQQQLQQQQQQTQGMDDVGNFDIGNISLPNLSDVNLSLLDSHLSENFSERLDLKGF